MLIPSWMCNGALCTRSSWLCWWLPGWCQDDRSRWSSWLSIGTITTILNVDQVATRFPGWCLRIGGARRPLHPRSCKPRWRGGETLSHRFDHLWSITISFMLMKTYVHILKDWNGELGQWDTLIIRIFDWSQFHYFSFSKDWKADGAETMQPQGFAHPAHEWDPAGHQGEMLYQVLKVF